MPPDAGLTLSELSALVDVPVRTIRYYIAQGLLPAPGREGPSTRYDDGFTARLRLIRQLRAAHLPLAEIRGRLAELTDDEAIALTQTPTLQPPDSALEYVRSLLGGAEGSPVDAARPSMLAPAPLAMRLAEEPPPALGEPPETETETETAAGAARPPSLLQRIEAATVAEAQATLPARPTTPARPATPERSQWERIVVEPGVELHVRRPLTRHQNRRVERLIAFARELQEGDKP